MYILGGFLVFIYALPFGVGMMTDNVIYDLQWLADLTTVAMSGLMQGGVYAMFAVGLTLIFGVMRVINVAHGEFVVLGAYLTYVVGLFRCLTPCLFSDALLYFALIRREDGYSHTH